MGAINIFNNTLRLKILCLKIVVILIAVILNLFIHLLAKAIYHIVQLVITIIHHVDVENIYPIKN